MYWTVRIIAVPPGEAPLWVREKWVGLELPTAGDPAPRRMFGYGVLSMPRSILAQWWGLIRGRAERISGYAVASVDAVEILAAASPEAAAWWRENVPDLVGRRRYFVFHADVCELV